jgi:cellulose synthase/poly-beta-1,6-N-acetylglucosamine synthase-like glycosyltransferase
VRRLWIAHHLRADGHRHVHGANLGIRASALAGLGGWSPLVSGEDVELAARARDAGLVIRRSGAAPVVTSARLDGRAPDGFAAYLRRLVAGDVPA